MGMEEEIFRQLALIMETTSKTAEKVTQIELHNARQAEVCKHHIEAIEQVQKTIYNDETGLKTRIQRLENCKSAVKTTKELWMGFVMGVLKILVATGLLVGLGIIFKAWKFFGDK